MCTTSATAEFELDRSIEMPGRVRVIIGTHACPEHGQDAVPAAQLLATELATCAVLYGRAPVWLELDCGESQLRIAVTHGVPSGVDADDLPIDEDGLRSALLDKLARSWGTGKTARGERHLWCVIATGHAPQRGRTRVPMSEGSRRRS